MRRLRPLWWLLASVMAAAAAGAQAVPPSPTTPASSQTQRPTNESGGTNEPSRVQPSLVANELPPSTPVITIHGVCPAAKAGSTPVPLSGCKTIVTRAEFEKLATALQLKMTPQVRRQLANQYPRILLMSEEAKKRGIDKDPHYVEMLRFTRMQLLGVELDRALEEEADKIPQSDINDYFEKNSKNFEQISVLRIFIPKVKQVPPKEGATPADLEAARKEQEAAMGKVAEDLHTRAAAGEDFDKLQKDAYEAAGIKATAPPTANAKLRRTNLPASQASVFDLKEGELSPVISDVSGFYIYKIVSRTRPTVADAQEEIRNTLRGQRLQALRQKLQGSISSEFNQDYFGPEMQTGAPGVPRTMTPHPAPPPQTSTQPKE
jgi:hypothetical protein